MTRGHSLETSTKLRCRGDRSSPLPLPVWGSHRTLRLHAARCAAPRAHACANARAPECRNPCAGADSFACACAAGTLNQVTLAAGDLTGFHAPGGSVTSISFWLSSDNPVSVFLMTKANLNDYLNGVAPSGSLNFCAWPSVAASRRRACQGSPIFRTALRQTAS